MGRGGPARPVLEPAAERERRRARAGPRQAAAEAHAVRQQDGKDLPGAVRQDLRGARAEPVSAHRRDSGWDAEDEEKHAGIIPGKKKLP